MKLFLLSFILALSVTARAQFAPTRVTPDSINHITKEKLLDDMDEYAKGVASKHVKPFTKIKRRDFFNEIQSLKDSADKYDVDELLVRLLCINALIEDEHTRIMYIGRDVFPFNCYQFDDGIYITATEPKNLDLLYSKVIAVNCLTINEVCHKIEALSPDKNPAGFMLAVQKYLFDPFVIHGLGIAPSRDSVEYTLINHNGETVKIRLFAKDRRRLNIARGFDKNVFLRESGKGNYWFREVDSGKYIYFKYARCYDQDKDHLFIDMEKDLLSEMKERPHYKVIIDLRDNGGGNPPLLRHFITALANSEHNKKGNIYVLIGRNTFSAAILNSAELRRRTYAILVGEETSGSVAHYGNVKDFKLPETKLMVRYSTQYVTTDEQYDGALRPDVLIPEKFSDYSTGIDAALQYAITH